MTAESVSGSVSTPGREADHQNSYHHQHHHHQQHTIRVSGLPDTPVAPRTSKAASTASSKGLNLYVTSKRRTTSGVPIGLPASPRPVNSPLKADASASQPQPQPSSLG